jgi:hypothetical protein
MKKRLSKNNHNSFMRGYSMNNFTNNKKTQMIAAVVADNMDYVKKSKSYLSESELKDKKYGRSYTVYIPDPGKVKDGLVADPDTIDEI